VPTAGHAALAGPQRGGMDLASFEHWQNTQAFPVSTKRGSVNRSIEQAYKVSKGLAASIFVDLYPSTAVGLPTLFQRQSDVAKGAPAADVK
jgi:hypothetical protein